MTIEVPEWIVNDIVEKYDCEFPDEVWTIDNKIDFNSKEFKDFITKKIEYAYICKDLDIAIENFIYEWKRKVKPSADFDIIFKGE